MAFFDSVDEQRDRDNHAAMFIFPAFMDMRRRLILTTMSDRTSSQSHAVPSLQNPLGIVESGCLHSKRLLLSVSEMFFIFIFFQLLFAFPDAEFFPREGRRHWLPEVAR